MDKISHLHFFVLVVETGSFSSVAKTLGVDPSTVSKSIQVLERSLSIQLFHRTTRSLRVTDAGQNYYQHVKTMLEALGDCEQRLQSDVLEPSGLLRINLPVSYGRLYVLPLIPEFNKRYPRIRVELNFEDAYVDIIEQSFDVSIRTGVLPQTRIVARQLSTMDFVTCSAPGFIERQGLKRLRSSSFNKLPWVRFRFKQSGKLMPILGLENDKTCEYEVGEHFVVDDGEALAHLCASGVGLAQFPHFIARDYIQQKKIVPVYKAFSHPAMSVNIMYAKREFLPERARVFVDFMREKIAEFGENPKGTWALNLKV